MGCLSDTTKPVIGIREDCSTVTPSSGLFLNDLEGITIHFADSIASKDMSDGIDLINKKIALAEKIIFNQISTSLAPYVRKTSLVNFDTIGLMLDDKDAVASENKLKGVKINIDEGSFIEFHLHQVGLWVDSVINTNIEVWDLISAQKLDDIAITTVAGKLTQVQVDKTYKTLKNNFHIAILYDASLAGTFKTSLYPQHCGGCRVPRNGFYINHFTQVLGVEIGSSDTKIASNFSGTDGTAGMIVDYSVKCSNENFVCYNSNSFALALLYKTAELLIREAVFSARVNKYVTVHKDLNKDLEKDFRELFEKEITNITANMNVPANDICFRCDPHISRRSEIPA